MIGYFPREAASTPEPFTGERLTAAIAGQVQIEHYHRYLFARSFCGGLDVLDVASGEGYGSAQLAQVARSVTGLEFAAETVRLARDHFSRPNLRFVRADARSLPLSDDSVDVVVSFETIEHFDGQDAFLAEVRRVLRPGGRFIVSTPDRETYSPAGMPSNRFHVREFGDREFDSLLRRHFPHVSTVLQRPVIGSLLLGEVASAEPPLVFERRGDRFEACRGVPRAPFIVSVASDQPVQPPPPSVYIERSDLDTDGEALARCTEALEARKGDLAVRDEQLLVRTRQWEIATAEATWRGSEAARAWDTVAVSERERGRAEARVAELERELAAVRGSLRTFLRSYLPMLRQHIFRRR